MPVYRDSEAFYAAMRALFACIEANHPRATDAIAASRIIIKLTMRDPVAEIVIDGRQRPVTTTFGVDGVKPDIHLDMAADTFHRLLLGEVPLQTAFTNGQLRVKGNIFKAMALGDFVTVSQRCYPVILRGISDK